MLDFLLYILKISLIADGAVIIVYFISFVISGRLGYRWRKMLWLFLALLLIIPIPYDTAKSGNAVNQIIISVPDIESIAAWENIQTPRNLPMIESDNSVFQEAAPIRNEPDFTGNVNNVNDKNTGQDQAVKQAAAGFSFEMTLILIWLIGALLLLNIRKAQYKHMKKQLLDNAELVDVESNDMESIISNVCRKYRINRTFTVMKTHTMNSPVMMGYFNPMIFIPDISYESEELYGVISHELTHYKQGDLWYKLLMIIVCDVYWFNPVLRLMKKMAFCDVEYVCDDIATRGMNLEEKKRYGNTIVKTIISKNKKSTAYSTQFSGSKKNIKERFVNLFAQKGKKKGYVILAVLLAGILSASLLLRFTGQDSEDNPVQNETEIINQSENNNTGEELPEENTNIESVGTFRVDSVASLHLGEPFMLENCYITNRMTGGSHFYIDENHVLWGYGSNDYGQLGIGTTNRLDVKNEEAMQLAENVVSVDASTNSYFMIYLTEDGKLYGTGSNLLGVLRQPVEEEIVHLEYGYSQITEPILLMEDVIYARAGRFSIVALKEDGSVWWWGEYKAFSRTYTGDSFLLYWTNQELSDNPVKMMSLEPIRLLDNCIYATTGDYTGAAITENGELYTWGFNIWGQCGIPVTEDDYVRAPVKVLEDVKMVWPEQMAFSDKATEIEWVYRYNTTYWDNLFVERKDGTLLACGRNIGEKERTIAVSGDTLQATSSRYSDEFLPIAIVQYSVENIHSLLSQCKFGMTKEEIMDFLTENQIEFFEFYDENGVKYLDIEDSRFFFYFNEDIFVSTLMQEIGSLYGSFKLGMSESAVEELYGACSDQGIDDAFPEVIWKVYQLNEITYTLYFNRGELNRVREELTGKARE